MKLKTILIGYPGSQRIVKASKYLTKKYMRGFYIRYLNYEGPIDGWAKYLVDFLNLLTDDYIIFGLDDYLLANPIRLDVYRKLLAGMKNAVCAKLCECTDEENIEYPVTTQYTIWDRRYLIRLLGEIQTPWEFELKGSRIFKHTGQKAIFGPALKYFTNSSLSSRWEGVRLDGLSDKDVEEVKKRL